MRKQLSQMTCTMTLYYYMPATCTREIQCRAKPTIEAQILLVKLSTDNMGYHQDHC